jgi:rfaE bifunctional protein nucleotidyltransferase chain/domain/rfaE bifunctional protein kinase chain/domain
VSAPPPLVVVGDALLDRDVDGTVERLSPDAPVPVLDERSSRARPGGAALAALLAGGDGHAVTLVTALGDDPAGREVGELLARAGVDVVDVGLDGRTPEKIRLRAEDRPLLRVDRGGGVPRAARAAARAALAAGDAILVADYGRGMASLEGVRDAVAAAARTGRPVVWDPHPRGPAPVHGVTLATPNLGEARRFAGLAVGDDVAGAIACADALVDRWAAGHVCVTCGALGAVLAGGGRPAAVLPAAPAPGRDPCGAGDRFSSRAAGALAAGRTPQAAAQAAVAAASAFVATGGAGAVGLAPAGAPAGTAAATGAGGSAAAVAAAVRARGGTVVATGGCFDLLHPGHVQTLQAARGLGDCLLVLLNGDESVRRLKGPGRPVVAAAERAAVLAALACVDAVEVFDEDTPAAALDRLRPDIWVKGGDYAGRDLPETAVLDRWGGRTIVVPTLEGHSTTRILEEAVNRVGS